MDQVRELLLIEPNPGDIRLVQESFKDHQNACHLTIVPDEIEAMRVLRRQDGYSEAKRPDFIFICSSMLLKTSNTFLQALQQDPCLHDIPVVILTATDEETTYLDQHLPGNLYLTKPLTMDKVLSLCEISSS